MTPEPQIEELSAYLDHELTGTARQEIEAHLATCETCRRRLGALQQTVNAIHELPVAAPPRAFTIPAQREQPRRWAPGLGWAGGAAAAAVVAIVAFNGLSHPSGSGAATTASRYAAPSEQRSGAGAQAGTAQPADKSALFALAAPPNANRVVITDSVTPTQRLNLATDAAIYARDGAIRVTVVLESPRANISSSQLRLLLVRDGRGVALPGPLPPDGFYGPPVYTGTFKISDLRLPPGAYRLVAIWTTPDASGAVLMAELPITISG